MNKVTFDSEGVRLTGNLYLPEGVERAPAWWSPEPGPASRN